MASSIIEKRAYEAIRGVVMPVYPKDNGAKKLGVAFCAGLHDEAARIATVLEESGFTVLSVRCKRSLPPNEYKIRDQNIK